MNQYPGTSFHDLNLDWLLSEMKNCLAEWESTKEDWEELQTSNTDFKEFMTGQWEGFRDFVLNYLHNLPLTEEVSAKIDTMVEDGTLLDLITADEGDGSALSDVAGQWLSAHITQETGYVIDDSLTVAGAAADAKAAGDAISDLRGAIEQTTYKITSIGEENKIVFYAKAGDSITVKTQSGNVLPTPMTINFYNMAGERQEYANLSGYRTRTFNITGENKEIVYAYLTSTATLEDVVLVQNNTEKTIIEQVANRTNQFTDVLDSIEDSSMLMDEKYTAVVETANKLYPLKVNTGDLFIVKTISEETFSGTTMRLYDEHGKYVNYYGFASANGNNRGIVSALNFSYISYDANQSLFAINISKANPTVANQIKNTNWGYFNATDRNSLIKNADARFVFFSDVHGSETNCQRIFYFAEKENVNAIINGGDTVTTAITDGATWYNTLLDNSSVDVLTCVGNHDAWASQQTAELASAELVYNTFIQPMVTKGVNIVQPSGASTNHLCYYYIDYDDIRVIVLYSMTGPWTIGWDSDQLTWFQSVLADSITNSKAVVCVNHAPYAKQYANIDTDSPLNTFINYSTFGFDNLAISQDAISAVSTFKTNGGTFICWLTGHTHVDYIMENSVYDNQMMINIATARSTRHIDGYAPAVTETWEENYDCFDYIGIDTTNKLVKVMRIGYSEDASMRIRKRFCYDYANNKIIANS